MKASAIQQLESFKLSSLLPLLSPVVILLLFYRPPWSAILAAVLFTALVGSSPGRYRTRGGSLVPAIALAAFLWLSAAVVFVLSCCGDH